MTTITVVSVAMAIAVWGAYMRVAGIAYGTARTILNRGRFVTFRMGLAEAFCVPDPFVLFGIAYALHQRPSPVAVTIASTLAAVGGAALTLVGWALLAWSWLSWPTLFVGHGVLVDHRLVTRGAYGFVRHPVYLAGFLIWLGLALAYRSDGAFLATVLYVIPAYLLYIRSEESMMAASFGAAYEDYRRRVPGLIPGWRVPRQVG